MFAAFLSVLAAAMLIGAGCMALRDRAPGDGSAANRPEAPISASARAPGRASRDSGEGRARFLLVRWQEPGMAPRALPLTEGAGGNPDDAPISIEFSAGPDAPNGTVSGYAGCNRFFGSYQKLASGVRFGALASTQMACEPARMQREIDFLRALQAPLILVGMQPSPEVAPGRQIIWKTASGALLQFAERPLPPRGQ